MGKVKRALGFLLCAITMQESLPCIPYPRCIYECLNHTYIFQLNLFKFSIANADHLSKAKSCFNTNKSASNNVTMATIQPSHIQYMNSQFKNTRKKLGSDCSCQLLEGGLVGMFCDEFIYCKDQQRKVAALLSTGLATFPLLGQVSFLMADKDLGRRHTTKCFVSFHY